MPVGEAASTKSHEVLSRAYVQLARIWYRQGDPFALSTLEVELSQQAAGNERYKDLVDSVRTAALLRRGELKEAVKGLKNLIRDDVPDMWDPGLLEFNLEVCADAILAAGRAQSDAMRGTLQGFWMQMMRRLYRIERPGGGRASEKNTHR